ncbi:hypothetical protein KHQ89_02875 [Mycoplasmatota bacterium]|nr:hypothetical protein KHQ89_02875 [Mycoplasmatota bacterium]
MCDYIDKFRGKNDSKSIFEGNPSPQKFIDLCTHHIRKVTKFIHDGSVIQKQFMRQFNVPNIDARREGDGVYDTLLVDSLHSNIKRYLFKHAGYRLKNLQHYMNFFVYRYNHTPKSKVNNHRKLIQSRNDMMDDLFNRIKKINKKITYRKFQSDLGITDILESVDKNYYFNKDIN